MKTIRRPQCGGGGFLPYPYSVPSKYCVLRRSAAVWRPRGRDRDGSFSSSQGRGSRGPGEGGPSAAICVAIAFSQDHGW